MLYEINNSINEIIITRCTISMMTSYMHAA